MDGTNKYLDIMKGYTSVCHDGSENVVLIEFSGNKIYYGNLLKFNENKYYYCPEETALVRALVDPDNNRIVRFVYFYDPLQIKHENMCLKCRDLVSRYVEREIEILYINPNNGNVIRKDVINKDDFYPFSHR